MDLGQRLRNFYGDLQAYGTGDSAQWQVAQIFNALLAEVKAAVPDDPIVAFISPAEQSAMGNLSSAKIGTLKTATSQLIAALDEADLLANRLVSRAPRGAGNGVVPGS